MVREFISLDDFYKYLYKVIFRVMIILVDRNDVIDVVIVRNILDD